MIRHHKTHSHFIDQFRFPKGGNAIIHCHDQFRTILVQLTDGSFIQAVALFPFGNVVCHIRPQFRQIGVQNDGCHNTIAVIVAVNADRDSCINCCIDGIRSSLHILNQKGVRQTIAVQERRSLLQRKDSTGGKHLCTQHGNITARTQCLCDF